MTTSEVPKLTKQKFKDFLCHEMRSEIVAILKIAIPIAATCLLNYAVMTETLIMCGHLSVVTLEAIGLAMSMLNAFGIVLNVGVVTACDTLFSQCCGGNKKRTGMFLQRSMMFCTIHPLFIGIFYMYIEPIFIALGQNPEISHKAAIFLQISIPGVVFNAQYYILVRYMQSQNIVCPPICIALIGNCFNVLSQYIFIFKFGLGYEASAGCQAATYFVQFLLALLYTIFSRRFEASWDGFKAEAFFDWKSFCGLAIAGVCHLCLEIICYEGCTFLAGIIGVVELGSQSILFQTESVVFMIPLSQGAAMNIRVGQSLGANKPDSARLAVKAGLLIATISGLIMGSLLLALKNVIPYLFTSDIDVLNMTIHAFPVIAFVIIMNHYLAVLNGMLRGCGLQRIGAFIVIVSYNVIAFPIALIMTFFSDFGILGLWLGISIGLVFCFLLLSIATCRQDMEVQGRLAQERIQIKCKSKSITSDQTQEEQPEEKLQSLSGSPQNQSLFNDVTHGISHQEFVRVVYQKGCLMLFVIGCFVAAVLIHLYFPFNCPFDSAHNSTVLNDNKTKSI